MLKFINLKKLTTTSILAVLMTGSLIVKPATSSNSDAPGQNKTACKNNNGIGNNYDIEVTLPSGESITVRIDPGNKGQMNKFAGKLAVENGIDAATFNSEIKPQVIDAEMRAKNSNTICPTDSYSTVSDITTNNATGEVVSVELVLSVDVSVSVDSTEFDLQKNGYKAAFEDPDVIAAIKALPDGLAVNMQFWSDSGNILETGWYKLTDDATITSFKNKFDSVTRHSNKKKVRFGSSGGWTNTGSGTDIKLAIDSAKNSLLNNGYNGNALVIDISGDGVSDDTPYTGPQEENGDCPHAHFCPPLEDARDAALAAGITINGLPIVNNQNTSQLTHEIDKHYEQLVIVGEGSFIEVAHDFSSFTAAAKKKILREISYAGGLSAAAVDDPFSTDEDTSKTGNVLTNDENPENKTLAVIEVNGVASNVSQQLTLPSGALLTVNSDGSFTYDPNAQYEILNDGESELDSFGYSIDDGYGKISSATVSMSVNGVTEYVPPANVAPDAVDDTPTTEKNVAVTIDVLANDTDSDGGTPVIESVNTDSSDGTATIVDGQILYTPVLNSEITDTFYYTISDGQGGTDTATVTVTFDIGDTMPEENIPFAD